MLSEELPVIELGIAKEKKYMFMVFVQAAAVDVWRSVTPRLLRPTLSFHAWSTNLRQCNTIIPGLRGNLASTSITSYET